MAEDAPRRWAWSSKIRFMKDGEWHHHVTRRAVKHIPAGTPCEVSRLEDKLLFRLESGEIVEIDGKKNFILHLECDEADTFGNENDLSLLLPA